jgi:DNA-binding response OmpR family regulator
MHRTEVPGHATPVLIVDADEDSRGAYGERLRRAGFEVHEAADGRDALVKASISIPTVIVTDAGVPYINGYELCALFRNDQATHLARMIMLCREGSGRTVARGRSAGADAVLVKPCPADRLLAEITQLTAAPGAAAPPPAVDAAPTAATAAADLPASSAPAEKRRPKVRTHQRFETTTPPRQPPVVWCPECELQLKYDRSHIGGVSERHPEQWDYYICAGACGSFQYRQRTRKLRRAD